MAFIAIEGPDGSGKTKLSHYLARSIVGNVKVTAQPHNLSACYTDIWNHVSGLCTLSNTALAFCFAANRQDHLEKVILPWLRRGRNHHVICDRYIMSSLVYQSGGICETMGDEWTMQDVLDLNWYAKGVDAYIYLDCPPEVCQERIEGRERKKTLYEKDPVKTQQLYRKAVNKLDKNDRIFEINAEQSFDDVLEEAKECLSKVSGINIL